MSNLNMNNHNNLNVDKIALNHKAFTEQDAQYKQSVIDSIKNKERYSQIVDTALEDFTGVVEAYKDGAFVSVEEMKEQMKIFMEEYAVNLINLVNEEKKFL